MSSVGPWVSPRAPWVGSDGGTDLPVDRETFWAYVRSRTAVSFKCPECGGLCSRDEADVGVGIVYGPYGCPCGWSEWDCYDQTKGPTATDGKRTDQWGYLYPTDEAAPDAREISGRRS